MATIKHITTPDGVTHEIGGGGGSSTYTLTKSGNTITLTGSGGDVSSVVDANTTYSMSISGDTLTLTPSSGSAQSVTIPDTDTTYTISISGSTITLTPSSGSAQTITIPDATTTSAGVMSASDKNKLNGIQSGAEVNVQSDWSQSDSSADDYIKNKPTIPTVNDGTLTIQQNGVTLDTFTANQSGNTTVNITASGGGDKNIWYATCATATSTRAKIATTTTGDFVLEEGSMVRVKFSAYNTATSPTINVDGTGNIPIKEHGTIDISTRWWRSNEVIDLVYDGTNFIVSDGSTASTTYYGLTKLSSSVTSTDNTLAATPYAVKQAYDLANSKTTSVTLTQAEYDALSDAEKNNGTVYYISDGEDCCLDGIIGSGELNTQAKTLIGAINELADILKLSVTSVQLASGCVAAVNNVRKFGNVVVVNLFLTAGANPTSGEKVVGTLPVGFRPGAADVRGALGHTNHNTASEYFVITTAGEVIFNNSGLVPLLTTAFIAI